MTYVTGPAEQARILASGTERTASGEYLEYFWYSGRPGHFEGAIVVKTDRFGQRWQLQVSRDSYVTVRVAAGMLGVTPMTVSNWLASNQFLGVKTMNRTKVIPFREVERVARSRGMQIPLTK